MVVSANVLSVGWNLLLATSPTCSLLSQLSLSLCLFLSDFSSLGRFSAGITSSCVSPEGSCSKTGLGVNWRWEVGRDTRKCLVSFVTWAAGGIIVDGACSWCVLTENKQLRKQKWLSANQTILCRLSFCCCPLVDTIMCPRANQIDTQSLLLHLPLNSWTQTPLILELFNLFVYLIVHLFCYIYFFVFHLIWLNDLQMCLLNCFLNDRTIVVMIFMCFYVWRLEKLQLNCPFWINTVILNWIRIWI